jgi:hypothetical protein
MRLRLAVIIICLAAAGCDGQSKADRASLDLLVTNGLVTEIREESLTATNRLKPSEVRSLLASLAATNRSSASGSKAQFVSRFSFFSGTNEIGRLDHFDDDTWEFGSYVFRFGSK